MYINKKFSQSKIAKLFGVQRETIKRWLKRLNIPIRKRVDVVSDTLLKYKRKPFSGNLKEKAYLMGLRCGDISAQKHGKFIRVSVSTTHPAMLHLFKKLFKKYGKVNLYPKYDRKRNRFLWCIYCDLDHSFNFLVDKCKKIPKWIKENSELFFSFLSGYFDSEGCISISSSENSGVIHLIIQTCDKEILEDIVEELNNLGFEFRKPRLIKKADHKTYNKDFWYIGTSKKTQVFKLLNQMKIKHEEKILKYKLAQELVKTNWKNAKEKILKLRNKINNDIKKCMEKAKAKYKKKLK